MWHLTQFRYSNGDLLTLYRESITSSVFCCAKSTFSKEKAKVRRWKLEIRVRMLKKS